MKRIYIILAAVLITATVWAQAPEKMSYQAVVRDASSQLVTSTSVGMQISILQSSATGTAVYVERQFPTTNANGLVTIEIGTGTVVSGDFSTIDWANDTYFIKTETDLNGGANYTITGTSQLLSVPYALHAKTAETANYNTLTNLPALNITDWNNAYSWGNHSTAGYLTSFTENDPVFLSWDKNYTDLTNKPVNVTQSTDGFMSSVDKVKLDNLENLNLSAGNGIELLGTAPNITINATSKPCFRWNVFHTYMNDVGWVFNNNSLMFGGVEPSIWTDGNATAVNISSDKEVQRTLFNKKIYPGMNAMVYSNVYTQYSSTNGEIVVVLMRVKNTTSSNINWDVSFYYTAHSGFSEKAGIALNGVNIATYTSSGNSTETLTIPANRTSTIIISSSSALGKDLGSGIYVRHCGLGFYGDCLALPSGLEFVDDLDNATGGWEQ